MKLKVHTKLIIGFVILNILLIISLYTGYGAAAQIMSSDDPEGYLSSYAAFTAVLFVVMGIISAGISIYLPRSIQKTLAELTKASNSLAAGNLDVKLVKQSDDEFGQLVDDIQMLIDNLHNQANAVQQVAEGDMTVEIRPKSENDIMGIALKKLVTQNHDAIGNVQDAAHQVSTSSAQVASASEALAQGSTEQASAIQQITASITDVAEKTRQNAVEANAAAELIAQAIVDVKKGNQEMQDMVVAMQDINKASESISKIIKVIDDIAFQTNILALNAAVEAARAGDAGKGFAVVAEEVRNLAAKSSAAAAETAEMIQDSIKKVEIGTSIANTTAITLDEITEVVKKSETIVTQIAEASNYQATAIAQIDRAIEQVSQVVQNNSATSEECAAASVELSNQASRMSELVSVYKLGDSMDSYVDAEPSVTRRNVADNEQIISLGEGFGKY